MKISPSPEKQSTQLLDSTVSLANILMVAYVKMLAFGQIGFNITALQRTLLKLLTVPTFELESTILRSSSALKEPSNLVLRSNGLRYLSRPFREFLCLFTEAHRLLWPTVLGVFICSLFLKATHWSRYKLAQKKPAHEADDHQPAMWPEKSEEKSEDPKKSDAQLIPKPKPLHRIWRLYNLVVIIFLCCELFFVVFYALFMITRYVFAGGMVDCIMDSVQNATQLRNETYLEIERGYCAKFGISSNYGPLPKIASDLYIRDELRNETFFESADYFWGTQSELFNFRMSCFFLVTVILFSLVKCFSLHRNMRFSNCPIQFFDSIFDSISQFKPTNRSVFLRSFSK